MFQPTQMKTIKVERIKPASLIIATILTPSGRTIRVEADLKEGKALLYQDGHWVGTADVRTGGSFYGPTQRELPWVSLMCDARLGAEDGSETADAYEALEQLITEAA